MEGTMAIATNPYEVYKRQGVMTAGPVELVVMLYDGCLKHLKAARSAVLEKDCERANAALLKAQDIVAELASSLDCRFKISRQLMQIYDYVSRRLREANATKETGVIDEVMGLMGELRESWASIKGACLVAYMQEE
ncbi:MAG: flagellar export chaperone FliS [Christensenellales bacterium]|jgi:flagellar protein FliS